MNQLHDILHQGDLCSLALTVGILLWIGQRLRGQSGENVSLAVAGFAFLGCALHDLATSRGLDAPELLLVVIRSVIAAGFALGLAWIGIPLLLWARVVLLQPPLQKLSWWLTSIRHEKERRQQMRAQAEDERRARIQAERWEQGRPERERQRQAEADRLRAEQSTREEAHAECEILYSAHEPEIGKRFPRELFQQFLARFAAKSPEEVQHYAGQLKALMQNHLQKVEPCFGKKSMKALQEWYDQLRGEITESVQDEEVKATQLYLLKDRYDQLSRLIFEEMMP